MGKLYSVIIETILYHHDGREDNVAVARTCREINGSYQDIHTNEIYNDTVIEVKEI